MAKLTPEQIAEAQSSGAEVKVIPKEVRVEGLQDLVNQMQAMQDAGRKSQAVMLMAIQQLTQVIQDKQMTSKMDLSELIKAVQGLHKETETQYAPVEWVLNFERDNRGHIATGMRFTPISQTLN